MKVADSQGISELCRPVIESFDCELWGIDFKLSSRNRLLRVYIDKSERSIEIEDCEQISKQISSVLDVEDVIQGEYVLEVSSPGIDRPLFSSEHFKKYVGSRVFCKLRIPKYGRRKFNGILSGAGDSDIEIKMDDASYSLSYIEIENANLIYDY